MIQSSQRTHWNQRTLEIINKQIDSVKLKNNVKYAMIIDAHIKTVINKYSLGDLLKEYNDLIARKEVLVETINPIISMLKSKYNLNHNYLDSYDDTIERIARITAKDEIESGPYKDVVELKTFRTYAADQLQNVDNVKELRSLLTKFNIFLKRHNLEQLNISNGEIK